MVLSEKMVDVIKKYDKRLREGNSFCKRYFAPNIPEKVYEVEIEALSKKTNKTELENEYLKQLLLKERKLRKMVG